MLEIDYTALYCDLAETYHVFGLDSLPIEEIAMLASGLREDSRIKQKMGSVFYQPLQLIATSIADNLTLIRHYLSHDEREPVLFFDLMRDNEEKTSEGFETGEDFNLAWSKFMEG